MPQKAVGEKGQSPFFQRAAANSYHNDGIGFVNRALYAFCAQA
jgi:hypothetical protein